MPEPRHRSVVVVGAGISGLATAFRLRQSLQGPATITVLEAGASPGGTMNSASEGGFVIEGGPNGFLDGKPDVLELAHDLGLSHRLIRARSEAATRWVVKNGDLVALPTSPPAFLASRLLSWRGKLRLLCEPLIRRSRAQGDESVASFARRRLGDEALAALIDPFVSGVFAGDPERLSLSSAFPRLAELEATYGSLIRASIRLGRERRKALPSADATPRTGPAGQLTSFATGMHELIDALAEQVTQPRGDVTTALRTGERVADLRPLGGRWSLRTEAGTELLADAVVLALPAFGAASLVRPLSEPMAAALANIPYAAVSVVSFGVRVEQVAHRLDGFGFLVPSRERRGLLGCLFDSSVYEGRAPAGHALLRSMVGGARRPELSMLPDDELVAHVRAELLDLVGLEGEPVLTRVVRWPTAIPQYELGHRERVAAVTQALEAWPGLFIGGNVLHGVAVNDCARTARQVAEAVARQLAASA